MSMYTLVITEVPQTNVVTSIKAIRAIHLALTGTALGLREAKAIFDKSYKEKMDSPAFEGFNNQTLNAASAYLAVYGIKSKVVEPMVTIPTSVVDQAISLLVNCGYYETADKLRAGRTD